MAVTAPLKWHGGKHYLAAKLVAMMPPHTHYVEPFFGGGAVLLAKDPEGVSEVANDIDGELSNFWACLRDGVWFAEFLRAAEATPFSEERWASAARTDSAACGSNVTRAYSFFVRCRQSLAGRMDSFAPLSRTRTRRGMNEQASAWLNAVDGLPAVHERLKRVVILNRDALKVIEQQDGPATLFYLDPPYLKDTRTSPEVYAHEMTKVQHVALLTALSHVAGKFMLSGYRSELYDSWADAHDWHRTDFDLPNHAAGGGEKRRMVECVWHNF